MSTKMRYLVPTVVGTLFGGGTATVHSGELAHYAPGIINVRDLLLPSDPGVYYVQYNCIYSTESLNNRNGDEVGSLTVSGPLGTTTLSVDPDLDMFLVAPAFLWVSPWHVLGARYGAFASTPFADNSIQTALSLARSGRFFDQTFNRTLDFETGGRGDVYVQPLWLGWSGKHYDISAGYGFYAPTGVKGMSLEFWENQLQAAGAWYPWADRRMAVTVAGTYEIPQERDDRDLIPGDRFTLNWGISQYLPLKKDLTILAELGVRGYSQWQVEEDSGSDVPQILNAQLNAKDEVHSAGLQAGLTFPPVKASLILAYMWEFGAEARFEGDGIGVTLAKGF